MKKVSQYYKELQYNVLQTAIDNLPSKERLAPKEFTAQLNLCSELMQELKELGYQITKIPKKSKNNGTTIW